MDPYELPELPADILEILRTGTNLPSGPSAPNPVALSEAEYASAVLWDDFYDTIIIVIYTIIIIPPTT
ncbi:hypothetical protein NX059_000904 [Plenodomus lindquistii]|nr:hypothetical protein NX059_000904 [Plenodomus lindquistii]